MRLDVIQNEILLLILNEYYLRGANITGNICVRYIRILSCIFMYINPSLSGEKAVMARILGHTKAKGI